MAKGIDFDDRYTIYLPNIRTTKWLGQHALMAVDPKSSRSRIELVERFGLYIKREEGYDFPQSLGEGKTKGYFFLSQSSVTTVQPFGVVVFEYFTPDMVHESAQHILANRWSLAWAWIHPFERRKGLLSRHWSFFHDEFGDFYVNPPFSKAMESFLLKQCKCVQCWQPSSGKLFCDPCTTANELSRRARSQNV